MVIEWKWVARWGVLVGNSISPSFSPWIHGAERKPGCFSFSRFLVSWWKLFFLMCTSLIPVLITFCFLYFLGFEFPEFLEVCEWVDGGRRSCWLVAVVVVASWCTDGRQELQTSMDVSCGAADIDDQMNGGSSTGRLRRYCASSSRHFLFSGSRA